MSRPRARPYADTMYILSTFENTLPSPQADAEQFVSNAVALSRHGHDVELLVPRKVGRERPVQDDLLAYYQIEGPIRIDELPTNRENIVLQHLAHIRAVPKDPRFARADVVYTRNLGMMSACLAAGQRVVYEHYRPWGDQIPPMQVWLRRAMTHPRFLGMVVHSEFAKRSYVRLGVPESQLRVCHNGWEPKRMEPRLSKTEARARLGLPLDRPIVVYSGRMNHKKGLDVVLAMARSLPHVLFVLVGSTGEGPIERAARGLPNVRIEPWQSFAGVAPYLYAADVLVIPPSDAPLRMHGSTVLPIKLFAYLAAGRPILAADNPDVHEILTHDRNAWLVRPGDVGAATSRLAELLDDPIRAARLGRTARADAGSRTWDARAERVLSFLEERLRAPRPSPGPWSARTCLRETGEWVRGALAEGRFIRSPSEGSVPA